MAKVRRAGGLLNYTTSITVEKTIAEIERILAMHGASAIQKQYDGAGNPTALAFKVKAPEGEVPFMLPMNALAIHQVLQNQVKAKKIRKGYADMDQARRVGWRILLSWIEAQMAIIETEMVTIEQVFLPYIVTGTGKTIYERFIEGPSKFMLPDIE